MPAKTQSALRDEYRLSKSQMSRARKLGFDTSDPREVERYRAQTNTRVNGKKTRAPMKPATKDAARMSIEEIEDALRAKGLETNDARTLKIQLEGLRAAVALRQQTNQLISRPEVQEMFVKIGRAFGGVMTALIKEIPPICEGLSANKSAPLVEEQVRKIQVEFCKLESEFWKSHA